MKEGELDDPKKMTENVANKGYFGNGDYQIVVSDTKHLEYVMSLIKQGL